MQYEVNADRTSSPAGHSSYAWGLAGKVSQMVQVVVRARFGYAMPNGRNPWQVTKDDIGILRWKRHRRYARLVELLVIWDGDPARKARKVVLSSLEIIGVQVNRHRVVVLSSY
jgi:hypothetical protein